MKKMISLAILSILLISGCSAADWFLSDLGGLDLSACLEHPSVCWNLYFDNIDKIQL